MPALAPYRDNVIGVKVEMTSAKKQAKPNDTGLENRELHRERELARPHVPVSVLQQTVFWEPATLSENDDVLKKSQNFSLRIGLIAGQRLSSGLAIEGEIIPLPEEGWREILRYAKLDFIIVESCFETPVGGWRFAQIENTPLWPMFQEVVSCAKSFGVPIVYWFTLDSQYHLTFLSAASLFDRVFCADPMEAELLVQMGLNAEILLPAVQPALYHGIFSHPTPPECDFLGVCNSFADIRAHWINVRTFCNELAKLGVHFLDTQNSIRQSDLLRVDMPKKSILGTVSQRAWRCALRSSSVYCDLGIGDTTPTERYWRIVEAASCRLPVIGLENTLPKTPLWDMVTPCESPENFLIELVRHIKDPLYTQRLGHQAWRTAVHCHSYSDRIKHICNRLGIRSDWVEYPSVTLITASNRVDSIKHACDIYSRIEYPSLSWCFVFNGPVSDLDYVKSELSGFKNVFVHYAPPELHIGACMNLGISCAEGMYVFRMDDSGYYGKYYLLDNMLHLRSMDFDICGKVFKYLNIEVNDITCGVYSQNVDGLSFKRPAAVESSQLSDHSVPLSGSTQGGKRSYMLENICSYSGCGTKGNEWLSAIAEKEKGVVLILDDLGFVSSVNQYNICTSDIHLENFTSRVGFFVGEIEHVTAP